MTPTQTVALTRYVKALCPAQKIDEFTSDAWHDVLAEFEPADCRAAVAAMAGKIPFISATEIRQEILRVRRDRLQSNPLPAVPEEIVDNGVAYVEWVKAATEAIASGRLVTNPQAIAQGRRQALARASQPRAIEVAR